MILGGNARPYYFPGYKMNLGNCCAGTACLLESFLNRLQMPEYDALFIRVVTDCTWSTWSTVVVSRSFDSPVHQCWSTFLSTIRSHRSNDSSGSGGGGGVLRRTEMRRNSNCSSFLIVGPEKCLGTEGYLNPGFQGCMLPEFSSGASPHTHIFCLTDAAFHCTLLARVGEDSK